MLHTRSLVVLFSLGSGVVFGCNGPKTSTANTAPGLTFTQRFVADTLCFDEDGDGAGQAKGCGTDPWMQLQVIDGAVQDGSQIGLTGGEDLIIKGIAYGPAANTTELVVGNFDWDDDSHTCFSGELEHQTSNVWVALELTGGVHIANLTMIVEIEGEDEGSATMQATAPLDATFGGDSTVICPPPELADTGPEELPGDTGDTAVP